MEHSVLDHFGKDVLRLHSPVYFDRHSMKRKEFKELIKSTKEGGEILALKKKPSRVFVYSESEVKEIREKVKPSSLSQTHSSAQTHS